jgi:hypothetical protein
MEEGLAEVDPTTVVDLTIVADLLEEEVPTMVVEVAEAEEVVVVELVEEEAAVEAGPEFVNPKFSCSIPGVEYKHHGITLYI